MSKKITGARMRFQDQHGTLKILDVNHVAIAFDDSSLTPLMMTNDEYDNALNNHLFFIDTKTPFQGSNTLTLEQQIKTKYRRTYVDELQKLIGLGRVGGLEVRKKAIRNAQAILQDDNPPGASSLGEWARDHNRHSMGVAASVIKTAHKNRKSKYEGEIKHFALEVVDELFLIPRPPSIQDVFDAFIQRAIKNLKLASEQLPCLETFRKWVWGLSPKLLIKKHLSRKEVKRILRNSVKKYITSRPLQRVEADGLNLAIGVNDENGNYLGTLLFIILIDCHTRMIQGYEMQIGKGEPASTVVSAIRHAICPKTKESLNPECVNGMPLYGVIEELVVDGGTGFVAMETQGFALMVGMTINVVQSYAPWLKPFIERLNYTIRKRFASNIGGYGGTQEEQKETGFDAETEAVLTAPEVRDLFDLWITEDYHQRPHSGLNGLSPQQKYDQCIAEGWAPEIPVNYEKMMHPSGLIRTARILGEDCQGGVVINRVKYNDWGGRIKSIGMRLKASGEPPTLKCKHSTVDLHAITVIDEIMGDEFVVETEDPRVKPGMPLAEFNAIAPSTYKNKGYTGGNVLIDNQMAKDSKKQSEKQRKANVSKKQRNAKPEDIEEAVANAESQYQADQSNTPTEKSEPSDSTQSGSIFSTDDINNTEAHKNV
jgi:putative transposase